MNCFSHEYHINHGEQLVKRYALRLILLTIELGHKRLQKVRWAYPDIALFL